MDRTDKQSANEKLERGWDTTQMGADRPNLDSDKDSSALNRQQHLNEGKQRSGINSQAGIAAEFGDHRVADFGGVDMNKNSTSLPADRQNRDATLSRDQGYQRRDDQFTNQAQMADKNASGANMRADQSYDRERQLAQDLMEKDRALTKEISDWAGQENRRDHLQESWGTQMKTDNRSFQTDMSANALSRGQMAQGGQQNASYGMDANPEREVGGVDHLQSAWDRKPDTRDFQTDKSANAMSRDQMAQAGQNASYATGTNPCKEVGGVDHISPGMSAGYSQAQNSNMRS
jgi:hypothetical protein